MAVTEKVRWLRVAKGRECPICEHDSWCSVRPDGSLIHCMRVESAQPAKNTMGGWIHRVGDHNDLSIGRIEQQRETPDFTNRAKDHYGRKLAIDARAKLAETLGVTVRSLEALQVGSGYDDYRAMDFTSWPERDHTGKIVGIVRRYWREIPDRGNKLAMRGGTGGLYFDAERVSTCRAAGCPVVIVEGGSDTAALLDLGINVIGRPSNLGGVKFLKKLLDGGNSPVLVIAERDEKPGRRGQLESCPADCRGCLHCFPGREGARIVVENLRKAVPERRILWRFPPLGFKDSREWRKSCQNATAAKFFSGLTTKG